MARLAAPPSSATILSLLLFLAAAATNVTASESQQLLGVRAGNGGASVKVNVIQLLNSTGKKARGAMAREFIDAHNKVRASVKHTPLLWDKNLATFARRWANQHMEDCDMIHSGGPYGENLFWSQQPHWTPEKVVESWAAEAKFYDPKTNSCIGGQKCQHYSQLVWKKTQRVGCAWIQCQDNGGFLTVCNYDPPGNYKSESPFQ